MTGTISTMPFTQRSTQDGFWVSDERGATRLGRVHRHEYFQIQVNCAGLTHQSIGAAVRAFYPGSLSFVLPYRAHQIVHPVDSRFYIISFDRRFLRPELNLDPLDMEALPLQAAPELAPFLFQEHLDFALTGHAFESVRRGCCAMTEESENRLACSKEVIRAQLMLLLATVCRAHEKPLAALARSRAHHNSRREAFRRVVRYVRENLNSRLSVAEIAAAAHVSTSYVTHLVKRNTGRTLTELIEERRMDEACEMLACTAMPVSEVARNVGFDDRTYFARRFRLRFGMTPRDYRARARSAESIDRRTTGKAE